jgi:hypothetical protein
VADRSVGTPHFLPPTAPPNPTRNIFFPQPLEDQDDPRGGKLLECGGRDARGRRRHRSKRSDRRCRKSDPERPPDLSRRVDHRGLSAPARAVWRCASHRTPGARGGSMRCAKKRKPLRGGRLLECGGEWSFQCPPLRHTQRGTGSENREHPT